MSIIPLHIQRRFDERWAARFGSLAIPAIPKYIGLKASPVARRTPTAKEEPSGLSRRLLQRAGFAAGRQILLHRAAGPRRISIPAPNPDLRSSADLRKSTKACYKQSRGDPQLFSDGFSYVRGVCSPQAFHEPKGRDRNERQNEKCSAGQESRH